MLGIQLFQQPNPEANPQLIASNNILQLSTIELEQAIIRELDENPALEHVERPTCPHCGSLLRFGFCKYCAIDHRSSEATRLSYYDYGSGETHNESNPLEFIANPLSLAEQIQMQFNLILEPEQQYIALYIVEHLDEHGYITLPDATIAHALHIEVTVVEKIIGELQSLDPAGICARNVKECLLIQLKTLSEQGFIVPVATHQVIAQHLEELGTLQFDRIRAALHITRPQVEEIFFFIRKHLHPYPAYHYSLQEHIHSSARATVLPSAIIYQDEEADSGYAFAITESQRQLLSIHPQYQQLRTQLTKNISGSEKEHIVHFTERTRLFLNQIQRRNTLMKNILQLLIDHQAAFLLHGVSHLRPLTQKTIAQELHVHVSTISRAIANKFVRLPSQEIIALHRFFAAELQVQDLIRQIIFQETKPLSDASIAALLAQNHTIELSRQMIANYRIELGIPAARQRTLLRHIKKD